MPYVSEDDLLPEGGQGGYISEDELVAEPLPHRGSPKGRPRLPMTEGQVNEDTTKTVFSTPARWVTGALGLPGLIDQGGRWLDEKLLGQPASETPLPTPDSLMEHARSVVPQGVADWTLHEPVSTTARIVGGTLDVASGLTGLTKKGARTLAREAVSPKAVKAERNATYKELDQKGIRFDLNEYGNTVADTVTQLRTFNIAGKNKTLVKDIIKDVKANDKLNQGPDWTTLENFRKRAGKIARTSKDGEDRAVAAIIRDKLDNMRETGIVSAPIPRPEINALTSKARDLAKRMIKHEELAYVDKVAKQNGYHFGRGNDMVKRRISNILQDNRINKYTPDERGELNRLGGTSLTERFGDMAGFSTSPNWIPQMANLAKAGGHFFAGGPVSTTAAAVGTAAKVGSVQARKKRLSRLMAEVLLDKNVRDPRALERLEAQLPYMLPGAGSLSGE